MKRLAFWSLLLGLVFGSFAFVACGDDDDDKGSKEQGGGDGGGTITPEELIGTWYLIDENSSEKVCVDVIDILTNKDIVFSELKAKAKYNWEPRDEDMTTRQSTYSFDGKRFSMDGTPMSGDIVKSGDKYIIQRYENEKAVGTPTELVRVNNQQEAYQVFIRLVSGKLIY